MKTFKDKGMSFDPSGFAKEALDLTPLPHLDWEPTANLSARALDKRYTTTTCGPEWYLDDRIAEAGYAVDATVSALENPNDEQARRYIHYFGSDYWNPTVRSILRLRYLAIKNEFAQSYLDIVCTWQDDPGTYAVTYFVPGSPESGATMWLYALFWQAPDPPQCGDNNPGKRIILIHEASHAALGSSDHGADPALDAYVLMWYAQCKYIPFHQANLID